MAVHVIYENIKAPGRYWQYGTCESTVDEKRQTWVCWRQAGHTGRHACYRGGFIVAVWEETNE